MYFSPCCTTVLLSCDVLFSASSADSLRFSLQKFYLKPQCVFDLPVYKVRLFKHILVTKEVMAHAGRQALSHSSVRECHDISEPFL